MGGFVRVHGFGARDCVFWIARKRIFPARGNAQVARMAEWWLVVVDSNTHHNHCVLHWVAVPRMDYGFPQNIRPRAATSRVRDCLDQLSKIVDGMRPSLASIPRSWCSATKYKFAYLHIGAGRAWRICVTHSASQIGMGLGRALVDSLVAVESGVLIFGLAYLVANAWWIARSLLLPPMKFEM